MKTKGILSLAVILMLSAFVSKAQSLDSKYGLDSAQTIMKASLYVENVKQKNYADALPYWRYVFNNAPKYSTSTYSNGVKIMRGMYKATKNLKYIDTLMMVYDQRIKYFGNHRKYPKGYILGKKGSDLFKYKRKDITAVKEAYQLMNQSIEIQGEKSSPSVVANCMSASSLLVKNKQIDPEEVIDNYLRFMEMADNQIAKTSNEKKKANLKAVKVNVEKIFFTAGVADCETLSNIFTPKFKASPEDMKLINKILKMLNRQECEDIQLYAMVAEKKYSLEPNSRSAANLAKMFFKKREFAKSKKYFEEAIKQEEDKEVKCDLLLKLATIALSEGGTNVQKTKKYALQALALNPNAGKAYLLIGKAYASWSKKYGQKPIERKTVYWAAVDKFRKAKKVDASVAEEAQKLISTYSKYFPGKEEAFFEGWKNGQSYKVGSWINENTTIRLIE
ncbi:MAG: tetratricopeptide repeat protein [Marinifilaceae bacterium]|jgi:tetratricopeptide (TPR) repeat protein|nr:tetratricopeptide repeat protein [Marinifilaceae bacterium]